MFSTDKFFKFSIPLQATSFLDPANPGPGTANGSEGERGTRTVRHPPGGSASARCRSLVEGQGFA